MGERIAEFVRESFSPKDRENLQAHANAVRASMHSEHIVDLSSKQRRAGSDWAKNASDIDASNVDEVAAAWRAALRDIIVDSDYRLLKIVESLSSEDIKQLLALEDSKYTFNADLGNRFRFLGLAKQEFIETPEVKFFAMSLFSALVATGLLFVLSELGPLLNLDAISARYVQIGKWGVLFIFIIGLFMFGYLSANRLFSYSLTNFGKKIVDKIKYFQPK